MRILVHDFGGYTFPVTLSRELAKRGHTVRHTYCGSLLTTPPGVDSRQNGTGALSLDRVDLGEPLTKHNLLKRRSQERKYGKLVAERIRILRPDVVLSGNTPLDAQRLIHESARSVNARFVYWLQDLIGVATDRLLSGRIPVAGVFVGRHYLRLERRLLRGSDAVVAITDDFVPILHNYGVDAERIRVIENWGILEGERSGKDNRWSRANGLHDKTCLLYAGTLGMKHNPDLILQLARSLKDRPDTRIVVISQGSGADWLRGRAGGPGLDNLVVMNYQPLAQMRNVLSAADVLFAILEPDAGVFSVPSKVLTYLCAGRALLLAVPTENLAARIIQKNGAGVVIPPVDAAAFTREAAALLDDSGRRAACARNALAYAERTFDIGRIADAFEEVLVARPESARTVGADS